MPSSSRSVLAVLAGCLAAFFHVNAIGALGFLLYPPPAGVDPAKPETLVASLKAIPIGAIAMVPLAWGVGTFAGSWLAARLAPEPRRNHGLVVGALFLVAAVANMIQIPYPPWFWAASLVAIPMASYGGATWGSARGRSTRVGPEREGLPS